MARHSDRSSWCGAINCTNSKKQNPELSFHRFPSSFKSCKRWVQNCGREDLQDKSVEYLHDNIKLCSLHFDSSQYHPNSKRLKQNAVPTLFNMPNPPNPVTAKRSHECPGPSQMEQELSAEIMEVFIKEELPDLYDPVTTDTVEARSIANSDKGFDETRVQEHQLENFLAKEELDIKEEPLIDRIEPAKEDCWGEKLSDEATGLLPEARISNQDGEIQIKQEYDLDENGGHKDNEVSRKRKRKFSQVDEAIHELEKVSSKHNLSQLVEGVLKHSKNPRTAFARWVSVKVAELPEPLWNGFQEEIFNTMMRYREMARRQTQQS